MNIQGATYLHYNFQTFLKIEIDTFAGRHMPGTFVYISKIIHKWIIKKFPYLNLPPNPGNYQKNQYTQIVDTLYSYEDCLYCVKTSHTDKATPNRIWITEVELHQKDNALFLGVKNAYTSNSPKDDEDYRNYSVPTFINKISQNIKLTDAEESVDSVLTIQTEDELNRLFNLINNHDRQLPVIVISQNSSLDSTSAKYFSVNNGYFLDGERLITDLKFISHIYYLPTTLQPLWLSLIGNNWGLYNGAVRTYYPHFDKEDNCYYNHPMLIPQKILSMNYVNNTGKEYFGGHAFRHILTHTIKNYNIHNKFSWIDYGFKFFYNANRDKKLLDYKNNRNTQEWCALLENDNDELNQQLQEMTALLEAQDTEINFQNDTIRKFESINILNQARIHQLEQALLEYEHQPKPMEYPNNYSEIPDWIETNFSGRIELLPRAVRSLKEATYKDINLVCRLIECLGTTYYNMRMNFEEKTAYDNTLKLLGVEDSPAISDSSAGRQGDEYYPLYNGKKHKLDRHLKKGDSRDPRECLRIYYFWDDNASILVIGSLPGHLKIQSSN